MIARELPKFCSWNWDRHGKKRVRFRKGYFSTYITGVPYSETFMRQYHAAMNGEQEQLATEAADRVEPSTINAVIVSFYGSMDFQKLKGTTKKVRRNVLEAFRELHGTKRVATLTPAHVSAIIAAKSNFPGAANNLLKVLRVLLRHAIDMGLIVDDPARNVRKFAVKSEGFHSWDESDISAFEARHSDNSRAILSLLLLLHTGQRRPCEHGLAACHGRPAPGPPR